MTDCKQVWRSVQNVRTVNHKWRSVSKDDGPCETYGPSTCWRWCDNEMPTLCIQTVSKNGGLCESYGLSTANNGPQARMTVRAKLTDRQLQITAPYQCGSIGNECLYKKTAWNLVYQVLFFCIKLRIFSKLLIFFGVRWTQVRTVNAFQSWIARAYPNR